MTNSRIFDPPTTTKQAVEFIDAIITLPTCSVIRAGENHWQIFHDLCETGKVREKLVADAVHAALAIESAASG